MKILVTGATGLIGAEVLRQSMTDDHINEVFALVRSHSEVTGPGLQVIFHTDYLHYNGLEDYFMKADALIWCLGISQTQVSKKQYEMITYDFLDACVGFCEKINPSIRFIFVSGDGADRTEKSRTIFKRLKGKAENRILQSSLSNFIIARPDAVNPKHKNKKAPLAYKLVYPLFPLVERLSPSHIIGSDILAKALLHLAKYGYTGNTLENPALRELGKR